MSLNLFFFSMRGSGAECFVKWVADHLQEIDVHVDTKITDDGRIIQAGRGQIVTGENAISLLLDQMPRELPGSYILVNSPFTTFATRAIRKQESHNVDPLVVEQWKAQARLPFINLERFFADPGYRMELAAMLGLPERDEFEFPNNRTPNVEYIYGQFPQGQVYEFGKIIPPQIAWVFGDEELLDMGTMFEGRLPVPEPTERTQTSYWHEGHKHYRAGDFKQAIECYKRSPVTEHRKRNLALSYRADQQYEKAEEIYKRSDLDKDPILEYGYFCFLQSIGKVKESWQFLEAQFTGWQPSIDLAKTLKENRRVKPYTDLKGKHLLVVGEGGNGDELQFARYLKKIKDAKQCEITLACHYPLIEFFKRTTVADHVMPRSQVSAKIGDYWHPLMHTPLWLNDFTIPSPLLPFHDKAPLGQSLRVGIAWQGHYGHAEDHWRSMSSEVLRPLSEIPGVTLVNLQHDQEMYFAGLHPKIKDFVDLAKVMNACHLIVTVDTATAHLAGVIGLPTLLMLSYKTSYIWGKEDHTTVWYPDSHTLIRQPKINDWGSVIDHVKHHIEKMCNFAQRNRFLGD